jgi:hypothetical protein
MSLLMWLRAATQRGIAVRANPVAPKNRHVTPA